MSRIRMWVPERPLDQLTVHHNVSVDLEGIYDVELIDKTTGDIKFSSRTKNVITDAGLNRLLGGGNNLETLIRFLEVGTGTTAPSVSDTTLVAPLTPRSSGSGNFADEVQFINSGSYTYCSFTRTRIFNDLEANGVITEMGLFNQATAGIMFSRVLIKDNTGTPTSIVKTANDVLRVRYMIRLYHPTDNSTSTGSFTWRGITYSSSVGGINTASTIWNSSFFDVFGTWNQSRIRVFQTASLVAATGTIASWGGEVLASLQTATNLSYTNGTFFRDMEFSIPGTQANVSSSGFLVNFGSTDTSGPTFQHIVSPPIVKSSGQVLTLRYRFALNRRVETA